ncbi:flavin monoamine oxidase family protein [Aspergillus affinis]|uniref:flavin monoamine oxidase family protein n=1 Tax=Aspergillus affinis TaxID=1070780 RepID=UPI0022FEFBC3|nr:uncharacterized protein KD926_005853 [Aspergillus affinis]KAI9045910.1 hypothetical protein KD926_005853 [Aspergillus affinis]
MSVSKLNTEDSLPYFIRDGAAQYLVGHNVLKTLKSTLDKEQNTKDYKKLKHFLKTPGLPIPVLRDTHGPLNLPPPPDKVAQPKQPIADLPNGTLFHVCIVGAGITGLFLAMLLDEMHPVITYDIFESSPRVGGRVYTHWFPRDSVSPWVWGEYYDVGAMRFPDIPIMDRVFKLFRQLDVTEDSELLIPFYPQGLNCPRRYNGITYVPREGGPRDPFKFSVSNNGLVPDATVNEGPKAILDDAFGYYKDRLKRNFEKGFQTLMRVDQFSTRDYIRQVIGTGQYDRAFTESVLDDLTFNFSDERPTNWYCIKGGTSIITNKMADRIHHKPALNTHVTSIEYDPHSTSKTMKVKALVNGTPETKTYDAVFATTTLPCMQRMELSRAGLSRAQVDAIRCLKYEASVKIAIEFETPWWITLCNVTRGGYAATDLPLRTCIYPSYVTEDTKLATLLCSYTWNKDAQRMGSLMNDPNKLKEVLVHDLALLHYQSANLSYEDMKSEIMRQFKAIHAYDWSQDPNTSGAFAMFGPGQFANYYPELVKPAADGRLFLAGEACSAHHGWIAGSLDSAYMALSQFLRAVKWDRWVNTEKLLQRLEDNWGVLREIQPDALEWQAILVKAKRDRIG